MANSIAGEIAEGVAVGDTNRALTRVLALKETDEGLIGIRITLVPPAQLAGGSFGFKGGGPTQHNVVVLEDGWRIVPDQYRNSDEVSASLMFKALLDSEPSLRSLLEE